MSNQTATPQIMGFWKQIRGQVKDLKKFVAEMQRPARVPHNADAWLREIDRRAETLYTWLNRLEAFYDKNQNPKFDDGRRRIQYYRSQIKKLVSEANHAASK